MLAASCFSITDTCIYLLFGQIKQFEDVILDSGSTKQITVNSFLIILHLIIN